MKNIHVLPTDNPSILFYNVGGALLFRNYENYNRVNIYITSDEEIKVGDWCFYVNSIYKVLRISSNNRPIIKMSDGTFEISYYRKVILTTDQYLIKDGVQVIDDEFLEWFVKNPSCEEVETVFNNRGITGLEKILKTFGDYKIIIPKEEPKQETFEEVAKKYSGSKKAKKIFSKKDMQSLIKIRNYFGYNDKTSIGLFAYSFLDGFIKKFKNK